MRRKRATHIDNSSAIDILSTRTPTHKDEGLVSVCRSMTEWRFVYLLCTSRRWKLITYVQHISYRQCFPPKKIRKRSHWSCVSRNIRSNFKIGSSWPADYMKFVFIGPFLKCHLDGPESV